MIPLYGHSSAETAYQVDSYPYGRLRSKIWFWIESHEKKGYRFCSRTENPKNGKLNEPKKGTYFLIAMNLFLDEKGHVQHSAISEYAKAQEILEFIRRFPKSECLPTIAAWASSNLRYEERCVTLKQSPYGLLPESEIQEKSEEIKIWKEILSFLNSK